MKYIGNDVFFRFPEVRIIIIWMRTWMNNTIHVQVQIIKVRNLKFNSHKITLLVLIFLHPAVKLRNTRSIAHVYQFNYKLSSMDSPIFWTECGSGSTVTFFIFFSDYTFGPDPLG